MDTDLIIKQLQEENSLLKTELESTNDFDTFPKQAETKINVEASIANTLKLCFFMI